MSILTPKSALKKQLPSSSSSSPDTLEYSSDDSSSSCRGSLSSDRSKSPFRSNDSSDHTVSSEDEGVVVSSSSKTRKRYVSTSRNKSGLSNYTFIRDGDFDIVWPNAAIFVIGHVLYFYSLWLLFTDHDEKMTKTWFFCYWVGFVGGLGITAGAHRLWSHKSYSARLPLRIFLMIGQCIAGQNSLYVWCRDHRVHHKFSETDADPHNTHRGFFFAHVGWLLRKKHPELHKKSGTLDFSDLLRDPVVKFQRDYYFALYFIFAVFGPASLPCLFWGETFSRSMLIVYVSRYVTALHSTWFVNSTAHMFGDRPYNESIQPRENYWVSYGAFGEGYHNYHHTFPWDYSTSELGGKLNLTKKFIDICAFLGLAYDLKQCKTHMIDSRKEKVHLHQQQLQQAQQHSQNQHPIATS